MARRRRPPRAGALSELQPVEIACQIATLQALYYVAAVVLFVLTTLLAGASFDLGIVLGWDRVRGDTTQGWVMSFVWILDGGICMPIAIVLLIARSKLVPDFALTIHFLHLLITTAYTRSLPRHSLWWLTMAGSSALCVVLGMWACRYRELQPVFFAGGRILGHNNNASSSNNNNNNNNNSGSNNDNNDNGSVTAPSRNAPVGAAGDGHRRLVDEEMGLGGYEEYEMDGIKSGALRGYK
ncbi:protein SYS1 [Geosmithia morbida]|uniref:Protein SYS1 n=1 Tax=Geosmithia morbida TaxID=1094350 RepID=A0A9P4Z067_9HYPO|nr:protein SYS1 [Geosmithia morbida]KAF4126120.1 protein SYS1 [Geosmithia morbida]